MRSDEVYQYIISHITSGAYGIQGGELFVSCPECGDESHFSINLSNSRYNCFKCPVGGHLASEIVKHRLEWKGLTQNLLPKHFLNEKGDVKFELPRNAFNVYETLYPDVSLESRKQIGNSLSLCERAFIYCTKRGLNKKQIKDYRIFIKPMDPRVYFPYWNEYGEIIYFMGRKMMGDQDDMRTKDSDNAEKPLYGRQVEVLQYKVVLVEGVFDHFATKQSYAIMGSSVNAEQMLQLRKDGVVTVYVMGDPDASASVINQAKKLRNFKFNAFPVFLHTGNADPGKLGKKIMDKAVDELFAMTTNIFKPIHLVPN